MSTYENGKKWSEDDVDQLLTSFFKDEMPHELRDATEPAMPTSVSTVAVRSKAVTPSRRQSGFVAIAGIMAVAAMFVAFATIFNSGDEPGSNPSVAVDDGATNNAGPVEDRNNTVNVNAGTPSVETGTDIDFGGPEHEIQLHKVDDDKTDEDKKKKDADEQNSE